MAAVFVDFPKNRCNFLHKYTLDIVRLDQFLTERRPMRSFSPDAVTTIALCKSAPMRGSDLGFSPRVCVCVCVWLRLHALVAFSHN